LARNNPVNLNDQRTNASVDLFGSTDNQTVGNPDSRPIKYRN